MKTDELVDKIDPHNVKAGDIHTRLFNSVLRAQMAVKEQDIHNTRIEVFDAVKELVSQAIADAKSEERESVSQAWRGLSHSERSYIDPTELQTRDDVTE